MPTFVVETVLSRDAAAECTAREWRARSVAGALRRQGIRVRFDRVVHAPEHEACLFLLDAVSASAAALVAELADLGPHRVVEEPRTAAG
jgi:hypothetical protein